MLAPRLVPILAAALPFVVLALASSRQATAGPRAATAVHAGRATYFHGAEPEPDGDEVAPPPATYRTAEIARYAPPAGQWYASVMYERWSHPLYAQPLSYRPGPHGFEIGWPSRTRIDGADGTREVRYRHAADLTVSVAGSLPEDARLAGASDWLARIAIGRPGARLYATVLHGSPFSYFDCDGGEIDIAFGADLLPGSPDGRTRILSGPQHAYGLFAPPGSTWSTHKAGHLLLRMPAGKCWFSIAALPDTTAQTLAEFRAAAFAFPVTTRVSWAFDEARSRLRATYRVTTVARDGGRGETLLGLYPHQWAALVGHPDVRHTYESVRGPLRLVSAHEFTLEHAYHGIVPSFAGLEASGRHAAVIDALHADVPALERRFDDGRPGPYWTGKLLGATVQLLGIAEAEGARSERDALLRTLERRMEAWFDGRHYGYFVEDRRAGTLVGLPQEYNSVRDLNDHHFHYGYWIAAAAQVALRDPEWLSAARWGALPARLVADIATAARDRPDYPFLRYFDVYEGHSWASGIVPYDDGNDQESSSEAVNAWAALILLGEATHDRALRDLGVFLYTSETAAIDTYWFDRRHEVFAADFGDYASVVFGGKYAYATWWTAEPRQILGINVLPLTPASTYLANDPDHVRRLVGALPALRARYDAHGNGDGTAADVWQDVIAGYLALADPSAARRLWNPTGGVEYGETRSHTLAWISALEEMGHPDFTVSADTTLYAVFAGGEQPRTYLAYNAGDVERTVHFSDGRRLVVPAHALARTH